VKEAGQYSPDSSGQSHPSPTACRCVKCSSDGWTFLLIVEARPATASRCAASGTDAFQRSAPPIRNVEVMNVPFSISVGIALARVKALHNELYDTRTLRGAHAGVEGID
jgi:hypothetical protein